MRYVDSDLSLEMWVSEETTYGGFEWAVIQWGIMGDRDFEVGGLESTFAQADEKAYVAFYDRRDELK